MHLRTLVVLGLLVGGLVLVVRWQEAREARALPGAPAPLFEGVQAERIDRIRVDHLESSVQLLLVLEPGRGWRIADPLEAPAEPALVERLTEALATHTALPAQVGGDPAQLGFEPLPRAVIEFETEAPGGERRAHRLELGSVDLDGQHLYVRRGGPGAEVVRTLRTFESLVDRPLDEWRNRLILRGVDPFSVVELRREGAVALAPNEPPIDMSLALVAEDGWRATSPFAAALDPGAVGLLVQGTAYLRADGFVDDAPVALAYYGLEQPPVRIELSTADGTEIELRLAPGRGESWNVWCSSDPRVYSIPIAAALVLCAPAETLVERDLARFVRERVQWIELQADGRSLRLDQLRGAWTLSVDEGQPAPADPERVGDLMSALERARVLALLPELPFEPIPPAEGGPLRVLVQQNTRLLGGELGRAHALVDGGSGVLFQREGDRLTTLVGAELVELVRSDPRAFENRQLVLVEELDLARIELERAGEQRVYVRNDRGRWSRQGTEAEAKTLAILVDRLLSVRRLEPGEAASGPAPEGPLDDAIRVTLVPRSGQPVSYELGRLEGPDDAFRGARGERAEVRGGVHASLVQLFEAGS